ncbi:MAG TPA: phospholipase D-like domain-containing protein [Kiritimatiellia bacterium]|nr:phospholipase D-like domain-containing protein [Kiritimatiellia bacterium]
MRIRFHVLDPRILRLRLAGAAFLAAAVFPAAAQRVDGPDWALAYSLPSQNLKAKWPGEYAVSDLLVERVGQLRKGDRAELATFTFSGDSPRTGGAAPLLKALDKALGRGAAIHFVADRGIATTNSFLWGLSLAGLAARPYNPLELTISPGKPLMHHKAALFDYGGGEKWVFVGSGNFTGAANNRQWNVGLLLRNPDLHAAYAAEMAEFRAGRFGAAKGRGHDGAAFRLADSWGDCWVRFGPPLPATNGTENAEAQIRALIHGAEEEIFFAMHRFNRLSLRRALVAAADRGVRVRGVIPVSDRGNARGAVSRGTVEFFADPANYQTTNRVVLLPARVRATGDGWDAGEADLVHLKYALIDPNGSEPVVIHGAANWTEAGLSKPDGNDESILFLRHAGIAQAFLEQFRRMTEAPPEEPAGDEPEPDPAPEPEPESGSEPDAA